MRLFLQMNMSRMRIEYWYLYLVRIQQLRSNRSIFFYLQIDTLAKTEAVHQLDLDALEPVVTSMVSTLIAQSRLENQFLVPAISILVPASEQTLFNFQVLKSMGVWDSRLYLVGMSEAVKSEGGGTVEERDLFQREIPMLVQSLIPRWKRLLYDARMTTPCANDNDVNHHHH